MAIIGGESCENLEMMENVKTIVRHLEMPILVFPILVVCIVAIGFIFRCSCSLIEWWLSFALTIAIIQFRVGNRKTLISVTAALGLMMGLLWLAANLLTTSGWHDTLEYHQPAIRMLASGWNPVYQCTPEGIAEATGLASDTMKVWHVIAMPKGVWYFSAAAYLFTKSHFNLLFPLIPLLLCSLFYTVYDAFRHSGKSFAMCVYIGMLMFVNVTYDMLVDSVVVLSAIGLLVTMMDGLRTGKWHWMRLIGFSFWMIVAKQPSLLHCAVFWFLFFLFSMWRKRTFRIHKFFVSGTILLIMFCLVNVAPYLTSYVNYGNPFYPRYSGDEEKYPTTNITEDFLDRNEDAAAMGHLGAFVNAFVSTSAATTYYALKTGKKDFCPNCIVWEQNAAARSKGAPTGALFRFMYCAALVVLCLVGGLCGRFIALCILIGCMAMPTEMIGYARYVPYAMVGCPLGVLAVISTVKCAKIKRLILRMVLVLFSVIAVVRLSMFCAVKVDQGYAIRQSLKQNPPGVMISRFAQVTKVISGNLILMRRSVPELRAAKIIIDSQGETSCAEESCPYFDYSFRVARDYPGCTYSMLQRIACIPQRKQRLLSYPKFVFYTLFVTLPKSIMEVVYG